MRGYYGLIIETPYHNRSGVFYLVYKPNWLKLSFSTAVGSNEGACGEGQAIVNGKKITVAIRKHDFEGLNMEN